MHREQHEWRVDRLEEHAAAVEVDGTEIVTLPRWILPRDAREGDVLAVRHELGDAGRRSRLTIEVDRAATERAKAQSAQQVSGISRQSARRDPGGDVTL